MEEYKTIRINKNYDSRIKDLVATSIIRTQKEYTEAMFDFFHRTGFDPAEPVKSVSGELTKLRNTVVSFIREQEKSKLNPMINQVDELTTTFINFMRNEAITTNDVQNLVNEIQKSKQESNQITEKIEPRIIQSNQEGKDLFAKFVSEMQPGITNYKIDKKLVKHYQNQFNGLE